MITDTFYDFSPQNLADWNTLLTKELKGVGVENLKYLHWQKIPSNAYYQPAMIPTSAAANWLKKRVGLPFAPNNWYIQERIEVNNPKKANTLGLSFLMQGAESLCFYLNSNETINWKDLLQEIATQYAPIIICNWQPTNGLPANLATFDGLWIGLNFDAINTWKELTSPEKAKFAISIPTTKYAEQGANLPLQLQLMAHQMAYFLDTFDGNQLVFDIRVGLDTDYFGSLASVRAARLIATQVWLAYGHKENNLQLIITAEAPANLFAPLDAYTNLLRGTTLAMSAALGGADHIYLPPFDCQFEQKSELGQRMAINTQLILKHEAFLDQVKDPAAGSALIENLTNNIVSSVWADFAIIEKKGGWLYWLNGQLDNTLSELRTKNESDINSRKKAMIGVNKYPNSADKLLLNGKPKDSNKAAPWHKLLQLQQKTASMATPLSAGLLLTGEVNSRVARVSFATNFLGCAGITSVEMNAFGDEENLEKIMKTNSFKIWVLCSDDASWPLWLPIIKKNAPQAILILAGNPGEKLAEFQNKGLDMAIHLKSNLVESLQLLIQKISS